LTGAMFVARRPLQRDEDAPHGAMYRRYSARQSLSKIRTAELGRTG
jgi:hypothetical protein